MISLSGAKGPPSPARQVIVSRVLPGDGPTPFRFTLNSTIISGPEPLTLLSEPESELLLSSAAVIISAYNNAPALRLSLLGYLRQDCSDFRLIIADDGSTTDLKEEIDPILEKLNAAGIETDHVWHEDRGFRKNIILNEAVRHCPESELLIFTDGDCIPPASFVRTHIDQHCPRSFHVAGAYRLTETATASLKAESVLNGDHESLKEPDQIRDLQRRFRKSKWGTLFRRRHRPKILGLNMAFDRSLFEEINGFDEKFIGWGLGEDSDLRDRAMRLRPRPIVRNLYTVNDVFHQWHPVPPPRPRRELETWEYYRQDRPIRCETGLQQSPA